MIDRQQIEHIEQSKQIIAIADQFADVVVRA